MSNIKPLPSFEDLVSDKALAHKQDQLTVLLNQAPPDKWVKEHPYIRGFKYLPIDKVEYLLKKLFRAYKIEVTESKMLLNAVTVTVRIHYQDPITGEWSYHDGVGAKELQTQKDSGNLKMDMSNINRGAMEMALPIAKTVAIKDACDHFGRLFGSDLNRKETIDYTVNEKFKPVLTFDSPNFEKIKEAVHSGAMPIEKLKLSYSVTNEVMEVLTNV